MDGLLKRAQTLKADIIEATDNLDLKKLTDRLSEIEKKMSSPDFWDDSQKAAEITKEHSDLSSRAKPWLELEQGVGELIELIDLKDENLKSEIETQLYNIEANYENLKKELRYSGPYDRNDAILSIYAGAGGTDAQDWAAMLLRMYLRWAERAGMKTLTIAESSGDEAGLKAVTIELSGSLAYGKLKNEHGVHRLVRLSPFNADNLRQTSFAKVEVIPKIDKPDDLEIDDKELKIDVFRAGGHGGQSVNTTDSAVRVTHLPTGISVAIQNERSQLQNKETAMTILRSKLVQLQMEQHAEKLSELKGPNEQAAWGNQIRSYVLHPYKMVKDLRTNVQTSDTEDVLDGGLDLFIESI